MRKLAIIAVLATGALVLPAQAKPPHPTHPTHAAHPNQCAVHKVGYRAGGTLRDVLSLTQTKGNLTPTTHDDRYTGSIIVNVKKANHGAQTGDNITFSFTDAKVKFHVPAVPLDRVTVHGTITKVHHGCSPITPTITVKKVDFNKPKT